MIRKLSLVAALMLALGALSAGIAIGADRSDDAGQAPNRVDVSERQRDQIACRPAQGKTVTIATAKLIIEYNATDDDMGVHGAFDDHGWSELCVYGPNGRQVLAVKPQAQLKTLTMAGSFSNRENRPVRSSPLKTSRRTSQRASTRFAPFRLMGKD